MQLCSFDLYMGDITPEYLMLLEPGEQIKVPVANIVEAQINVTTLNQQAKKEIRKDRWSVFTRTRELGYVMLLLSE